MNNARKVILIQPFDDVKDDYAQIVYQTITAVFPKTVIKESIALPQKAYISSRNRYRADSLLRYLDRLNGGDTVVIGLTTFDISTTKGGVLDWGIMGLGYRPGYACVVSTFRLQKSNLAEQLAKVALHELGHTQGLDHCIKQYCLMRDAEGGNPLNEEKEFCASCKMRLQRKGLQLN